MKNKITWLMLSCVMVIGLMLASCPAEPPPEGELTIIAPDFLAEEWRGPLDVFEEQCGIVVELDTYPVDTILSNLMSALETENAPGVAMVYDGWLGELDEEGHLEHLSLESAYFPVLLDNEVLGTRVPWAEGWTVVVPAMSQQENLALELLQHPAIWMRPVYDLEEYRAFAELLEDSGYELVWSERTESSMEIGGIPIEIVVIPSTVKDGTYYELIIARDQKGKTYTQTRLQTAALQTAAYGNNPSTVSSATLKTIYESFMYSYAAIDGILTAIRPGYCSQAGNCFPEIDPGAAIECIANAPKCIFDWISQSLSADEWAALGLRGGKTATALFNSDYAWGSRLHAFKLYNAMLTQDDYSFRKRVGCTEARVRNDITSDSGFKWLTGFNLRGRQTLNIIPTGHKYYENLGVVGMVTEPRVMYVSESIMNLFCSESTIHINAPLVDAVSGYLGQDGGGGALDAIEAIPIDWEMDYDAQTQLLTVTFSVEGKACYGVYELCQLCAVGGGAATATAKMDGTDVHLEFRLEAYVEGECGIHPCMHGQIGGGMGIELDIYYPDPCLAVVTTTYDIGWGGHGDALNIKRESCDPYEVAGPSGSYNICGDQSLQNELNVNDDFTSRYGSPVTSDVIKTALADYAVAEAPPCPEAWWEVVDPDITFNHVIEPSVDVSVLAPACLALGEEFETAIDMSWVENLAVCHYYVHFNPDVLGVVDVTDGKIGYVDVPVEWHLVDPGTISIEGVVPRTLGVTGSGCLATIRFIAISPEETYIALSDGILTNTEGREITTGWREASILVWEAIPPYIPGPPLEPLP